MYPRHTLPYLTSPYLTYATYRSKKQEASQKNRCTQTATRRGRGRGRWGGADKPSSKGSVVPPKYLGSLFKKIRCTILSTCTCRYGTFYQVKLYLLSPPISFSRSMHLSLFSSLALGTCYQPNPTSDSVHSLAVGGTFGITITCKVRENRDVTTSR